MTPIAAAALIALAVRGDRPFQASTDRSYGDLMKEAMERMHEGMTARQTGNPDRDFVIQMIPHHQGAIDMAEALLIYGKDPQLRQLAKGIITEQQNEIQIMRLWQERQATRPSAKGGER